MTNRPQLRLETHIHAIATVAIAVVIGWLVLNPIWARYRPPFEIPKVLPAITAPVDGPFYLWNSERGYQWEHREPLSLWFHPLMSVVTAALPKWLPANMRFWISSLAFAVVSLMLTYRLASLILGQSLKPKLLPLVLLAPGALGIATGNAEIPTLCFDAALLLSALWWRKWSLTVLFAALAILTKPNSLYMVAILGVYLLIALWEHDTEVATQSLIGILTLVLCWVAWIEFVDSRAGQAGTYWQLRLLTKEYVAGDPMAFMDRLARAFLYGPDTRDRIRYSTALIIPIVNLWILILIPFSQERHRYALAAGNMAMLGMALAFGNPNKIIVYTTTLPGYFVAHLALVQRLTDKAEGSDRLLRVAGTAFYFMYCAAMLVVYVLGTPLGWYF